ncbi:DciA family protein [Gordonia sp. (in: high G+C Gram-positive bacteria)]|uniref:DciA family protein n=1 Tax=Gordonia sp. (in: high G+C Gram-positive bacteria) TaxID=84139 RepID=UPI0039E2A947
MDEANNPAVGDAAADDGLSGYELAKKALQDARAKSPKRRSPLGKPSLDETPRNKSRRRWSGSGPDHRDPQSLGSLVGRLSQAPGWQPKVGAATVINTWDSIVGQDLAAHAKPTRLDDTILYVSAESTAWATQLRYVQGQIIAKIAAAVGDGVVTQLRITGPQAPSWRKGPRHVPGRGPRDTYG